MEELENNNHGEAWKGGDRPFKSSYGKLMMWFFLITDALTFTAFLVSYGFYRYTAIDTENIPLMEWLNGKNINLPENVLEHFPFLLDVILSIEKSIWPVPEEVFSHFPFLSGENPLYFVALMTFILIMSSVTMVLAVNYGHKMQKKKVVLWLTLTIIGGATFLGSQAWEWGHFIHGDKGAIQLNRNLEVVHIAKEDVIDGKNTMVLSSVYELMNADKYGHHDFSVDTVINQLRERPGFGIRLANKDYKTNSEAFEYFETSEPLEIILGAGLKNNEYGTQDFGDCFFFITGFHGFHVFSGVIILIVILINVIKGTYQRRGHYEMVEKVGLYWHFVDLVWVFVFTFFYLV